MEEMASSEGAGVVGKSTAGGGGSKCGRWNPTAEQVKVLTELFRAGLRTPSTEQIQRISSHLSAFGKIESKNVFYWFQNHKARERLHHKKRRREPPFLSSPHASFFPALPPDQTLLRDALCGRISIALAEGGGLQERETLDLFPASSHEASTRVVKADRRDELLLFSAGRDSPQLDLRLSYL